MREIVLDTETTGLDPASGHRLVEIAGVELLSFTPTGSTFHAYINPQRDMPHEAFRIHGLSSEFLSSKPLFHQVVDEFLSFVGDSKLIIHNAEFDMRFINSELERIKLRPLDHGRVLDTLALARKKFPNASNSLDALCSRFRINNAKRVKHGALLDAELLAEVYVELMGGRQTAMVLPSEKQAIFIAPKAGKPQQSRVFPLFLSDSDREAHSAFVQTLGEKALWNSYFRSGVD